MKRNRRVSKFLKEEDTDPLSVVVNLFDVAMVFAVALMVAMVMHMKKIWKSSPRKEKKSTLTSLPVRKRRIQGKEEEK